MRKVFVGMSGGVDSSVTALLMQQQGYDVTGVYMKNWTQDLPGIPCPWEDDFLDAKRVAVQLGIDFKVYDFQREYKQKVVDYMLREYKAGRTPNPDVMCNQEVKFGLFLEACLEDGADMVATGHYAKTKGGRLFVASDKSKDQTYFLYRASSRALKKTLYPLGGYLKADVRKIAARHNLVTATKKESMGLCFVGKVGIRDFLSQYVQGTPGRIINQHGETVGEHDGAIFYTIGQRHGLSVGGGLPYYVIGKDMKKNELYVTTDLQDPDLWNKQAKFTSVHWINEPPKKKQKLTARMRHLGELIPVENISGGAAILKQEVRALTPGQSIVFYAGEAVLGGGILI